MRKKTEINIPAGSRLDQSAPASEGKGEEHHFPVEVFPEKLQQLISQAQPALGIHPNFLSASILFAFATAIGNKIRLAIKKGASPERPILFLVLIGNPNSNKTGALKFALRPLQDLDSENYQEYTNRRAEYQRILSMDKEERVEANITSVPEKPIFKQKMVSDLTREAVASVHLTNPDGIGVYRDEISGWVKDFKRYNTSSGEQEFWMGAWSGIPITVNRKNSDPLRISFPTISVAGTIQPGVLDELIKEQRGANGFVDRFLFSWPQNIKKPKWTLDQVEKGLLDEYSQAVKRLSGLTPDTEGNISLQLTPDAREQLLNFFNDENKQLCDGTDDDFLKGVYGKFDIHTARITILLHAIWWAYESADEITTSVSKDTIQQSIEVARYFRREAEKVHNWLHQATPYERLTKQKKMIYDALPDEFTKKQGTQIAFDFGMAKRTFGYFLSKEKNRLFEHVTRGVYTKIL